MSLPTASALDRAAVCPASEALPHFSSAGTSYRESGAVKHAFLEAVPNVGPEEAIKLAPEKYREELALIDLSKETGLGEFVDKAKFAAEVTFAFDIETGKARVLGQGLGRDYSSATVNEVVGTVDLVGVTVDAAVVPDVKTGHAYLDPERMRQLKFLSLAACAAYSKSVAISGIIRLREDGSSYFSRVEFDEFSLSEFELELRDIVAAVRAARVQAERGERLETVEGEHCRYCPAFNSCPSKMALVKAFAVAPDALGVTIEGASEEELALAWERADALEKVIERVKDSIRLRARQRPVHLGKGWVLAETKPIDQAVKEGVATAVLTKLHGLDTAKSAIEEKTVVTKTSIGKALRKHVLRTGLKIGELEEAVFDAIRAERGFITRLDVKKRKANVDDFALLDPGPVPVAESPALPDAAADLKQMMADGAKEHAEAMAKAAEP